MPFTGAVAFSNLDFKVTEQTLHDHQRGSLLSAARRWFVVRKVPEYRVRIESRSLATCVMSWAVQPIACCHPEHYWSLSTKAATQKAWPARQAFSGRLVTDAVGRSTDDWTCAWFSSTAHPYRYARGDSNLLSCNRCWSLCIREAGGLLHFSPMVERPF